METNEGALDRVVRLIVGIVLIIVGAAVVDAGAIRWILIVVGAIALATGAVGWCGLYAAIGCSTKTKTESPEAPPAEGTE